MNMIESRGMALTSGEVGVYQHKLPPRRVTAVTEIHNSTQLIQAVIDVEERYGSLMCCPKSDPEMTAIQKYSAVDHREPMSIKRAEISKAQAHAIEIIIKRYLTMVPVSDIASEVHLGYAKVRCIIDQQIKLGHIPRGSRRRTYRVNINGHIITGTSRQMMKRTGMPWQTVREHPIEALQEAGFNE
jgi:hypothetical protein